VFSLLFTLKWVKCRTIFDPLSNITILLQCCSHVPTNSKFQAFIKNSRTINSHNKILCVFNVSEVNSPDTFVARLKEASTWRGLIFIATAFGLQLAPAMQEAIVTAGIGLAGVAGAVLPDSK
jgi:hypothetical protein